MHNTSIRLPQDLYDWLSAFPMDGATTISDKIRESVASLKRLHEGGTYYVNALAMHRDLSRLTRDQLAAQEANGVHSEVMAIMLEHIPALGAALQASQAKDQDLAKELEAQLVRRVFQFAETLLRQSLTSDAAAFDPQVIQKNAGRLVELAQNVGDVATKKAPAASKRVPSKRAR